MIVDHTILAQQIITSNDPTAYSHMLESICDPDKLENILNQIPHSDVLHFTFTEMLGKSILNGEFCPINETKSDDNTMKENSNEKVKLYLVIIPRLFQSVTSRNFDNKTYVINSALTTIAICLKDLCDNPKNLPIFINLLSTTLFPYFKPNQMFTSSLNGDLTFMRPSESIISLFQSNPGSFLALYKHSTKIMIELIEYITLVTVYKSYYEYRRNIYTFRNTYMSSMLNVAVEYYKLLVGEWRNNQQNEEIIKAIVVAVSFIEKVITYPFSLTLHEFQADDEAKDSGLGLGAEIYFPTFYRNILCDVEFLDMICSFYQFLLKQLSSVTQLGQTVYSMVRVLGRIMSSSVYTFNTDQQRKTFRSYCTDITISMLFNFKFYQSFYIHSLCDIFCKVLGSYTTIDLQQKRQKLYEGVMFFCLNIVENCQIKLQDGKRNPLNRAFNVINTCISETKQNDFANYITTKAQQILQKAFIRLYNWQQAQKIISAFGKDQHNEIQCFEELFQYIPAVFSFQLEHNLNTLRNLQIQKSSEAQQIIWLHLCANLLPNHMATREQTEIILKYFKVAKEGNTLACLHYIKVLVKQVMFEMDNGIPSTPLWSYIAQIQTCTFTDFILYIIQVCKKTFQQTNTDIIDYALQVFKSIYVRLRKHSNQSSQNGIRNKFDPFYQQVKQLISSLSSTVFETPKFFKRRVQLFTVISTIWINSQNYRYLQEIYNLVSADLKKQVSMTDNALGGNKLYQINKNCLVKYMHDVRGLLEPIQDANAFNIVCELAIADMEKVLPLVFRGEDDIRELFQDEYFIKAFCKMVLQFVTDLSKRLTSRVQTELPFQIYDLFKPYLLQAVNFQYPKCLIPIWSKFCCLNPLQQMLPLPVSFKQQQSKQFPDLIRQYFQNIHRVELPQLQSLYPYIEDRIQHMSQWWQQVIRRRLYPSVSLVQVVYSRIAVTKRQKQELAKLLYMVGKYDAKYWNVEGWGEERHFVKAFLEMYK